MALAKIADLWTPDIWIQEMREKQATFPSIFNSGAVAKGTVFDDLATGGGVVVNLPFFKDITDQADEIQIEDTGPTTLGIPTGLMKAPIMNRVTKNAVTALATQVSGATPRPMEEVALQLVARRLKQRNATLVALLRGAFGTIGAAGVGSLLSSKLESFDETGLDATNDQTMNADLFIRGKALMGELADELASGAWFVHPNVLATLEIADKNSFMPGVISGLPFTVRTYRGVPIFTSSLLVRAGTGTGFVYDSYLIGKGVIAYGDKPQSSGIDVASLQYFPDPDANNERIYDRTRFLMHLNGMKYNGTPAGQSATNAELAVAADWSLTFSTANRVGVICFVTNA
jgi:hypothetical protein